MGDEWRSRLGVQRHPAVLHQVGRPAQRRVCSHRSVTVRCNSSLVFFSAVVFVVAFLCGQTDVYSLAAEATQRANRFHTACSLTNNRHSGASRVEMILLQTNNTKWYYGVSNGTISDDLDHLLQIFSNAIFTARRYVGAVYIYAVVMRLSVRISFSVCCHKPALYQTAKRRITQTTPYDSPGTPVFWCQKSRRNSNGVTPYGAPYRGRVGSNWRFSTNISQYLRNGAR